MCCKKLYALAELPLCGVDRVVCCVGGVVAVEREVEEAGEEGYGSAPPVSVFLSLEFFFVCMSCTNCMTCRICPGCSCMACRICMSCSCMTCGICMSFSFFGGAVGVV